MNLKQFDFNGEYDKLNEEVSTNLLKILSEWFEYSIDKEILNYNSAKFIYKIMMEIMYLIYLLILANYFFL
ncbi:hypothetical protein [Spiroplasma endosymbiont of Cantharis lateralis]|uniref:hypothetical protein n=1 Tax=Spiroplasma endosymbiont of Cantharis lateralis TaxID=3066277 RepID=UPI00313E2CBE